MSRAALLLLGVLALAGCDKVPIVDIEAGFALADAAWFEEEETLFVFYRVNAQQGLGPDMQIELKYRTDTVDQDWAALHTLPPVHTHVPVDCGPHSACGSMSLHVAQRPRDIGLRLRYHREGDVTLLAQVTANTINRGEPDASRSLLVYGVLDASNTRVQWRARHQFPTLRNEEVEALGLRRYFRVEAPRFGEIEFPLPTGGTGGFPGVPNLPGGEADAGLFPEPDGGGFEESDGGFGEVPVGVDDNPYGYGRFASCPPELTEHVETAVETTERAIFAPTPLPLEASTFNAVCARATVTDALGSFTTAALARKNPEVAPAFPSLRSPIRENVPVRFLLRPCARTISDAHLQMQEQRLLFDGSEELCLENWDDPNFATAMASRFRASIDSARTSGADLVLVIVLHHDDRTGALARVLEAALDAIIPAEQEKSTPRLSGAFVFDSFGYDIQNTALRRQVLWCPAKLPSPSDDLDSLPSTSQQFCALLPDILNLDLGPFSFGNLPILPTRPQYLTFVEKYSEAQAGRMVKLTFLGPERTPSSDNVSVGGFGVATFFNNERISAVPSDAFSYCAEGDPAANNVVFRTDLFPDPVPLQFISEMQAFAPQPTYSLGVFWDFPFLTRLNYEVILAGAATAFDVSVPFGIANPQEAYYGAPVWLTGEFPLRDTLLKCTRFCTHPTFDSAGVYNVRSYFSETYRTQCYRPRFPTPGEGGFPRDP